METHDDVGDIKISKTYLVVAKLKTTFGKLYCLPSAGNDDLMEWVCNQSSPSLY